MVLGSKFQVLNYLYSKEHLKCSPFISYRLPAIIVSSPREQIWPLRSIFTILGLSVAIDKLLRREKKKEHDVEFGEHI